MKPWMLFVLATVLCWGAYVPTLRHGQMGFGPGGGALRAFLFVGVAYFLIAAAVLAYMQFSGAEPLTFTATGVGFSTFAGILGAIGALGIVFALKYKGPHLVVAPLVFAGAPMVNTLVSMLWKPPVKSPSPMFYVGILLAAGGAALMLRFKPE